MRLSVVIPVGLVLLLSPFVALWLVTVIGTARQQAKYVRLTESVDYFEESPL